MPPVSAAPETEEKGGLSLLPQLLLKESLLAASVVNGVARGNRRRVITASFVVEKGKEVGSIIEAMLWLFRDHG